MKTDEIQEIITRKYELLARDTTPPPALNRSEDMSEDQKTRYINYLAGELEKEKLVNRAMHLVLEDFKNEKAEADATRADVLSRLERVEAAFAQLQKDNKSLERENARLEEKLKFANKNRYASRQQKVSKDEDKHESEQPSREEEEEHFDGTEEPLSAGTSSNHDEPLVANEEKKERDLSNRPSEYKTSGVKGEPVLHYTDEKKVPGRVIGKKMIKVFHLDVHLVEEQFEIVQYAGENNIPRWGYFPKEGHPQFVTKFKGTRATPEFMQALAYEVYVKNVTFGLMHQWLIDLGMQISKNTLRNWLKKGKIYLDKLIVELKKVALEKDSIVNCDETWCKVRKYDHYRKCYMWVLVNKKEQVVIFFYDNGSRGRKVLTDFLGDAELKALMSDGYNAYVFLGDELKSDKYKNTVHLVCMAHLRAKFVKALEQGGEKMAAIFLKYINMLFALERAYDKEGISPEERQRRRRGLQTKEIIINLAVNLKMELSSGNELRSGYMTEALNYLKHFWKQLFAYIEDGEYPIDNNLAERAVRPVTTKRKNSLHFGSEEGAGMAAVYHSVVSTVKLQSKSVWDYLGKFFKGIFNGCRDFSSLMPQNIDLALCQ